MGNLRKMTGGELGRFGDEQIVVDSDDSATDEASAGQAISKVF